MLCSRRIMNNALKLHTVAMHCVQHIKIIRIYITGLSFLYIKCI